MHAATLDGSYRAGDWSICALFHFIATPNPCSVAKLKFGGVSDGYNN